jgi:parallel beta-helix repeat protein
MTTGVLCPTPILQFFGNDGNPAVGGSVLTQVGGSNAATYQDVGLTSPLPNPIPLNSRGEVSLSGGASSQCFLTPNVVYTFTIYDAQGNQLNYATYVNGVQVDLSQAALGASLWPYNAAFDGAPVVNNGWPYGDPRRFGMVGDGAADDTVALNAWASGGGALTFPSLTALISDEITLVSNTSITGCGGSTILQSVANKAGLRATSQSEIAITGMAIKQDPAAIGATAYVAGVVFDQCTHCTVEESEFTGQQWCGVYLVATSFCTVRNNYIHDLFDSTAITFTGAVAASATNATLNANWPNATGIYVVGFVETAGGAIEGKAVTLTKGATTATWSPGLTNNCNAAATATISNSCDIGVHSSASLTAQYNIIDGNYCLGNTNTGIEVQDPYSGVLPVKNLVTNNKISVHKSYGILCYMPDSGDSFNQIIGNYIAGIQGAYPLNQSSGAGIYVVGAGAGGTMVCNNIIRDCCQSTINSTLAPAGIGISGTSTGAQPIVVSGNSISDMSKYHGIILTGCLSGASVTGNVIRQPAGNTTGHGIYVVNGNAVSVTGNTVTQLNTTTSQRGILFQGISLNATNHVCSGNTVTGGHISQIECAQSGSVQVTGLTISGNTLDGGDASCIPLLFNSTAAADIVVTGNFIHSLTTCVSITACTGLTFASNRFKGPGATALFLTAGVCTSCFFDRSNVGIVSGAAVSNGGTGAIVEVTGTGNTDPAAGTWAVGDTVWRTDAIGAGERMCTICYGAGTGGGTATFRHTNVA